MKPSRRIDGRYLGQEDEDLKKAARKNCATQHRRKTLA
jgi:hypothetical protein